MKVDPIVSAYAESFLSLATAEGVADRVEEELHELERLYQTNPELKEFINNPTVKAEGKKNALTELMGDKLTRVTLNLLNLLIDQDRGRMFPKVAEEYYRLASAVRAKVSAEVITAVPIPDGALEQLGAQLKKLTKKDVYLRTRVDESIIGGVVVKVGDKVLDGSVRSKLAQMRKQMVG